MFGRPEAQSRGRRRRPSFAGLDGYFCIPDIGNGEVPHIHRHLRGAATRNLKAYLIEMEV